MKLWNETEFKVYTGDIETLACCFTAGFKNADSGERIVFEVSAYKNELSEFLKFYKTKNIDYVCGFNYKNFDAQILQWILETNQDWDDFTGLEIADIIYRYVQNLIENQDYKLRLPYWENQFSVPCIDVFCINGLDNEARMTSLKAAAFQTDGKVEEMPIHHSRTNLTREEIDSVISYMWNDIDETERLLQITLGNTEIKGYSGFNQLELRYNIKQEFGLDCLNLSEIRLADELLKREYAKATNKKIKDIPKKGFFRKKIELKYCLPKYISFQTKQLQDLHNTVLSTSVSMSDKFENKFTFGKTKYVYGLGGAHSVNLNEIWEETEDFIIEDDDVASYYPAIVVNNGYFPYHLGKELLNVYKKIYLKRLELKPLAKTDKRVKGIVEAYKLILNSSFGKFGSPESWLFDKQTLYSVTLTGQFSLLMLIEMFELEGIRVISANSDGLTTYFHRNKLEKKRELVKKWQEITNFEIETVSYKKFIYSTVNDYIAVKSDGEVKTKGDFDENVLLFKNKSRNIVPLALKKYFTEGIKPEDFIKTHKNIYDFCIRQKANKNFNYELVNPITGSKQLLKKMIRYFVAKEGGILHKVKSEFCDTNASKVLSVEAEDAFEYQPKVVICNEMPENREKLLNLVDFDYYVDKVSKIIDKIEGRKFITRRKNLNKAQLELFI